MKNKTSLRISIKPNGRPLAKSVGGICKQWVNQTIRRTTTAWFTSTAEPGCQKMVTWCKHMYVQLLHTRVYTHAYVTQHTHTCRYAGKHVYFCIWGVFSPSGHVLPLATVCLQLAILSITASRTWASLGEIPSYSADFDSPWFQPISLNLGLKPLKASAFALLVT